MKIDLHDFFHSIDECDVFRVFRNAGYNPLVAFELARICTTPLQAGASEECIDTVGGDDADTRLLADRGGEDDESAGAPTGEAYVDLLRFFPMGPDAAQQLGEDFSSLHVQSVEPPLREGLQGDEDVGTSERGKPHLPYARRRSGVLPQGAPTSPALSNLVFLVVDELLAKLATRMNLVYARYADDLHFSSSDPAFGRSDAVAAIRSATRVLQQAGFRVNAHKTTIAGPGARRSVLGLLVNGDSLRLSREFRKRLAQHEHYVRRDSVAHFNVRGFTSYAAFRQHVLGLFQYAADVDPDQYTSILAELKAMRWPTP